jgi:hypothetical protein
MGSYHDECLYLSAFPRRVGGFDVDRRNTRFEKFEVGYSAAAVRRVLPRSETLMSLGVART